MGFVEVAHVLQPDSQPGEIGGRPVTIRGQLPAQACFVQLQALFSGIIAGGHYFRGNLGALSAVCRFCVRHSHHLNGCLPRTCSGLQ